MDLPCAAAEDVDVADAIDALQNRLDLVFDEIAQLHWIQIGCAAQHGDRRGRRVELHQPRTIDIVRQRVHNTVDTVADIVGGRIDVRAPFKRDPDGRTAFRGAGADLLHARNRADALLDRTRHQFLHVFRTRVLIRRGNRHSRKRHVRHHVNRQFHQRHKAQDDDNQGDHRDEYRSSYGKIGNG